MSSDSAQENSKETTSTVNAPSAEEIKDYKLNRNSEQIAGLGAGSISQLVGTGTSLAGASLAGAAVPQAAGAIGGAGLAKKAVGGAGKGLTALLSLNKKTKKITKTGGYHLAGNIASGAAQVLGGIGGTAAATVNPYAGWGLLGGNTAVDLGIQGVKLKRKLDQRKRIGRRYRLYSQGTGMQTSFNRPSNHLIEHRN